jgi:hypothetical protein
MRSVSGQSQGAPAVTRVKDGNQHSLRCHLEREGSRAEGPGLRLRQRKLDAPSRSVGVTVRENAAATKDPPISDLRSIGVTSRLPSFR